MNSKLINRYYLVTFISELARTIPHPILTILLIDQKGLNLAEITFVQIFFYLGVLLFEIPSGYLADLGYRKSCYIGSFGCMIIAYSLIYMTSSLWILAIAWLIYGIAGALTSGNLDGYIVNQLKSTEGQGEIKHFNVKKTNIALFAGIGGAVIGSILYPVIATNIYPISISLYTIAVVIAAYGIHLKHDRGAIHKIKVRDIKFTKQIKLLLILICAIELYYVGFYQYWQVLYQNKGIDPSYFGLIYIIFSATVICSNKVYSKIRAINDLITVPIFIFSALISILYLDGIIFCLGYPITLFIANLYVIEIYTQLYEAIDAKATSSMLSITSSANRIFGIVILGVLTYALTKYSLNLILIGAYMLFAICLIIVRIKYHRVSTTKC